MSRIKFIGSDNRVADIYFYKLNDGEVFMFGEGRAGDSTFMKLSSFTYDNRCCTNLFSDLKTGRVFKCSDPYTTKVLKINLEAKEV